MKKFYRIICMIIVVAVCVSCGIYAGAINPKASEYINSYDSFIQAEGGGEISIWYDVCGNTVQDEIGVTSITLEEKRVGSAIWEPVEYFSYTDYPGMMGRGTISCYGHIDYQGIVGASYRATVRFWAGSNNAGDSRIIVTNVVIAS